MTASMPEIKVIYEDNHLLVVEKPVNIPSQKDESGDPDMLSILRDEIKKKYNKPGNVYLGLVHRLDRPVGGVMVFARTSKAASRLSEQVRVGAFKKTYIAVVHGNLGQKKGKLVHYLLKDGKANMVRAVEQGTEGAREAVLDYRVEGYAKGFTLVKIDLHTGRSHQIRVQFFEIGHPLYGDQKYGTKLNRPGQQIALWSHQIIFQHPTLRQEMSFESMPPMDEPWSWFENKI